MTMSTLIKDNISLRLGHGFRSSVHYCKNGKKRGSIHTDNDAGEGAESSTASAAAHQAKFEHMRPQSQPHNGTLPLHILTRHSLWASIHTLQSMGSILIQTTTLGIWLRLNLAKTDSPPFSRQDIPKCSSVAARLLSNKPL